MGVIIAYDLINKLTKQLNFAILPSCHLLLPETVIQLW